MKRYCVNRSIAAKGFRMFCSRVRQSLPPLCAVLVCLSLLASEAKAQTTCIPPAVGVPFAPGPPKWWDSTVPGSAAIYNRIDDPRWKTASSITHGEGATEHLSFRALHHTEAGQQSVYMSWWVKVAPSDTTTQNVLYVGLRPSGGGTNLLLKVQLTALNAKDTTDYSADVYVVDAMGNFGTPLSPDPSWTNNIRIWANQPSNTWAVHVNVPIGVDIGSGAILGTDFNMWYEVLQGTPSAPAIEYTWPRGPGFSVTTSAFVETVPVPANWPSFHLSTGPADPMCATGGITIDVMDIGTNHPMGPGYISKTNLNTFFAKPTNKTSAAVNVGDVHARFRLANWGTQPDPNDVVDPATLWRDIRGLGDVTQTGPPATIAVNNQWNITGTWTLDDDEQPEFDGVNRWDHQCMLVELSGPNLTFLRSSVHRNMNFVPASKYTERAQVSVVSLPPTGGLMRDVYLYVETKNMPKVDFPGAKRRGKTAAKTAERPREPKQADEEDERPLVEKISDTEPTYVVHGYYDTGQTIFIGGVTRPVLRPMISYGYFVEHTGNLAGWKHLLQGAQKIADNWYKISVPQNGTATVTNTIEAIEPNSFALIAHGGVNIPHGDFDNLVDSGLSLNVSFEYAITNWLSAIAAGGYHTFKDGGLGSDLDIYQEVALHARFYPINTRIRPFINVGSGIYKLDPGDTKPGFVGGVGLQLGFSSRLSLEADYNYHLVNDDKVKPQFSTIQVGVRTGF